MKRVVLTFIGYYLPGFKAGGPIQSIANMVEHLSDSIEFRIITRDRDSHDATPYPSIRVGCWNNIGGAKVFYGPVGRYTLRAVYELIKCTPHDVIYLNSFFSPVFTFRPLLLRRLGLAGDRPVVLAPRGELSQGAQSIKAWKKAPYMHVARILSLYRDVIWHATSEQEAADIRYRMRGVAERIIVAPNMACRFSSSGSYSSSSQQHKKRVGSLRLLFLSRIARMKNLAYALKVLGQVHVPVIFNVYGPVAESDYWTQCQSLMAQLPPNTVVRYCGVAQHGDVARIMAEHDLLFLPTLGENYGHVIAEALAAGTPVLISDRTPWKDLEGEGVGWVFPLESETYFAQAIERVALMSESELQTMRLRARCYAARRLVSEDAIEANRRLFEGF